MEKQGKHRYYRLASKEGAIAVESIANLIPEKMSISERTPCIIGDITYCRTFYDHLAGKIVVDLTQALIKQEFIVQTAESFLLTPTGGNWFSSIGISVLKSQKPPVILPGPAWIGPKESITWPVRLGPPY